MNSRQLLSIVLTAGTVAGGAVIVNAAPPLAPPSQPGGNSSSSVGPQRKAVSDAQAEVSRIRGVMTAIRTKTETTFSTKDDWVAAKKAYDSAKSQYDAAVRPVLEKLRKKPEYVKAVADQAKAQAVLDGAKSRKPPSDSAEASADDTGKPPGDPIKEAAELQLKAGLERKRLETEALTEDPKVVAATANKDEAKKAWDALQSQVTDAVQSDPEYIGAQRELEQADLRLGVARQALAQSEKAARDSADQKAKTAAQSRQQQQPSGGSRSTGSYR